MNDLETDLYEHIAFIYGEGNAGSIYQRIFEQIACFLDGNHNQPKTSSVNRVTEKDAILITYGDMVQAKESTHLQTLGAFLNKYLAGVISTIHILPFFPYSSDDGFSVIDYHQVNPEFGNWENIANLGDKFRLMFDAVVNHISAQSDWFKGYLQEDPEFQDYFYEVGDDFDFSEVFRPRALPVLTSFDTASGEKKIWTTFSADQIDLNYENPATLSAVLDVILDYVSKGASFIRLDAIGFIWKESGTDCIHRPQAHRIIQLISTVLDIAAPQVSIITETNVPHKDNIAYFGDGYNEAQMVYNFSLPPLTLHTFHSGNVQAISKWARTLSLPSEQTTFFNFLASHDGVGLMPVRGILTEAEIEAMADRVKALGGFVSYKSNPDGTQMAYEMNINYLDALGDPNRRDETISTKAKRFLCSQAIMLALRGVPGIYFHSLLGSQNWFEGVKKTGRNRSINRQKLEFEVLEKELADPESLRNQVFRGYRRLLNVRKGNPAFHPNSGQEVLKVEDGIFALLRTSQDGGKHALCLHNVTSRDIHVDMDLEHHPLGYAKHIKDSISGQTFEVVNKRFKITISPFQVLWITT
jgi:sucrose phosphorylase